MVALGLVVFAALATFLFNFADILLWLSKD